MLTNFSTGKRTMALHTMKLTQFAGAALLLGSLAPQTFAQNASITPSGQSAPIAGAAVPSPVAAPTVAAGRVMMDVSFRDIEVTEILNMISQSFNVPIVIASDVRGIILPAINLPNTTSDAAIQAIAMAAGLKHRKQSDGIYLIAKSLPEDPTALPAITAPGISPGFGGAFNPGPSSALPNISSVDGMAGNAFEIPQLVGNEAGKEHKRTHEIRIKNVPPTLMAFWLDPANHDMPLQLQKSADLSRKYGSRPIGQSAFSQQDRMTPREGSSETINSGFAAGFNTGNINPYTQQRENSEVRSNAQFNGGGNRGGGGGGNRGGNNRGGNNRGGAGGGGVFDLPTGVDRIVAIDPQNALLVFGTDEGVRELADTIQFLDRPLRQVEIEAQFVRVTLGSSDIFGINYSTSQGNFNATAGGFASGPTDGSGSLQVGFVRGNFQATLSALVSQNRVKILTSPRVLAINNLTASLQSQTSTPVVLATAVAGGGVTGGTAVGQNLFYITTSIGLTVTPTINNDDTITVLMQPELSSQQPGAIAPTVSQQTLETIANVRDGETIALGGLKIKTVTRGGSKIPLLADIPVIGSLFRSKTAIDSDDDLIIFLTARIIRRAEDDANVPGT